MENGLGVEWSMTYPIRYDPVSNQTRDPVIR